MRTTVTLEPDTEALLKRVMRERDLSFKQAINEAVRRGLTAPSPDRPPFRMRTHDMGPPKVDITKANQLAGQMEDEAVVRILRARE